MPLPCLSQTYLKAGPGISTDVVVQISVGHSLPFYECKRFWNGWSTEAGYIEYFTVDAPSIFYAQGGREILISGEKLQAMVGYSYHLVSNKEKGRDSGRFIYSLTSWGDVGWCEIGIGLNYSKYFMLTLTARRLFKRE